MIAMGVVPGWECLVVIFCIIFPCTLVTGSKHLNVSYNGQSYNEDILLTSAATSITVYIGGISFEKFHTIENELKNLIASTAETFCHSHSILPNTTHVSSANIQLTPHGNCPKQWFSSEECTESTLSIQFATDPSSLSTKDTTEIWEAVQNSKKYSELGLKVYSTTRRTIIIIIVIVIIIIILLALVGAAYYKRDTLKDLYNKHFGSSKNKTTDECHINDLSTKNEDGQKFQYHPQTNDIDLNIKYGVQNQAFMEENSSSTENNVSQKTTEVVIDDFDSDDDINFPSPLTAPALPPRPIKTKESENNLKTSGPEQNSIHYLCTTLKY